MAPAHPSAPHHPTQNHQPAGEPREPISHDQNQETKPLTFGPIGWSFLAEGRSTGSYPAQRVVAAHIGVAVSVLMDPTPRPYDSQRSAVHGFSESRDRREILRNHSRQIPQETRDSCGIFLVTRCVADSSYSRLMRPIVNPPRHPWRVLVTDRSHDGPFSSQALQGLPAL